MKITYFKVVFLVIICSLLGCSNGISNKYKFENSKYISFTVTNELTGTGEAPGTIFESHVFCYDLQTQALSEVGVVPYNSQYPLTAYDRSENKIYYSASAMEGGRMPNSTDQLYSLDLISNETTKLTSEFYAINYIIPLDEDIILVACPLNAPTLMLFSWSKKTNTISKISWDEDLTFTNVYYQHDTHHLLAFAYSSSEHQYRISHQDIAPYVPLDFEVYNIDWKRKVQEKLFTIQQNAHMTDRIDIESTILHDEGIIAKIRERIRDGYYTKTIDCVVKYDFSGNRIDVNRYTEKLEGLTDFIYITDDERYIYYIKSEGNTLCVYDTLNDMTDVIYEAVFGYSFVNNATVLSDY